MTCLQRGGCFGCDPCEIKQRQKEIEKEKVKNKVPGYFDYLRTRYVFVGSGKGGKVFMTLYFKFGEPSKRHRLDSPGLPIRFSVEEARADLAAYAHTYILTGDWENVECVFLDAKKDHPVGCPF